jgi:hypothetical protein
MLDVHYLDITKKEADFIIRLGYSPLGHGVIGDSFIRRSFTVCKSRRKIAYGSKVDYFTRILFPKGSFNKVYVPFSEMLNRKHYD